MSETPDPYGQPPSNPPGQPPANPYGQQPAGTPYGQAPAPTSDKRPGTVTAAGWITILLSTLVALACAVGAVLSLAFADDFADAVDDELDAETRQELNDAGLSVDDLTSNIAVIFAVVLVVLLVWAIIAAVLASLAMKRQNWARIMLVVSCVVAGLGSLIGTFLLFVPVVVLAGAIATLVLLFTGGASQWYAAKGAGSPSATPAPPG